MTRNLVTQGDPGNHSTVPCIPNELLRQLKAMLQPLIESSVLGMGCQITLEHQPHRIARNAQGGCTPIQLPN